MKYIEAILIFFLVEWDYSTTLSASASSFADEVEQSNLQDDGGSGGFLRGKQTTSPNMKKTIRKLYGNIFSKNKHKSSSSAYYKGKGAGYAYTAKGKGHYYNYKGYPYKGMNSSSSSSKGKGPLPDSNFLSPKGNGIPYGSWITKGKGAVPKSKGKGVAGTKGKGRKSVGMSEPTMAPITFPPLTTVPTAPTIPVPTTVPNVATSQPSISAGTQAPMDTVTTPPTIFPVTQAPVGMLTTQPTQSPATLAPIGTTTAPIPVNATIPPTQSPLAVSTLQPTNSSTTAPSLTGISEASSTTVPTRTAPSNSPSFYPSEWPSVYPSNVPSTSADSASLEQLSSPTMTPTAGAMAAIPDTYAQYGLQPNCAVFDNTAFNICLDISSLSGEPEPWFELVIQAAARWERIIKDDPWGPWSKDILEYLPKSSIATTLPESGVDDIYISVFESDIDGKGGLFALAGPDLILGDNKIVAGSIQIDPNDIDTALDKNVFLPLLHHEIAHVLGFGTMWEEHGLMDGERYIGVHAREAWEKEIGCSGDLPLSENHWNEDCIQNEFMTPFFRFNRPAPVSSLTMGALEDLGYVVNREEEDPFGLSDLGECGDACPEASNRRSLQEYKNATVTSKPIWLSSEGEQAVLAAAARHFRQTSLGPSRSGVVSLLYQENQSFHSRIVSRSQTETLD